MPTTEAALISLKGTTFAPIQQQSYSALTPQPYLTKLGQLFSEFLATALLSMGIFSISNMRHAQVIRDLAPLWVCLLILCIGGALGLETGYAMNMARDFAPRCFA